MLHPQICCTSPRADPETCCTSPRAAPHHLPHPDTFHTLTPASPEVVLRVGVQRPVPRCLSPTRRLPHFSCDSARVGPPTPCPQETPRRLPARLPFFFYLFCRLWRMFNFCLSLPGDRVWPGRGYTAGARTGYTAGAQSVPQRDGLAHVLFTSIPMTRGAAGQPQTGDPGWGAAGQP